MYITVITLPTTANSEDKINIKPPYGFSGLQGALVLNCCYNNYLAPKYDIWHMHFSMTNVGAKSPLHFFVENSVQYLKRNHHAIARSVAVTFCCLKMACV